jgi:very-short-patch-repair endonuclease
MGRKFRRQQSIGPYIVDFYCPAERLVVELDGAAHDSESSTAHDHARDRFLRSLGLIVVRLENRNVLRDPDGVLAYISQHFTEM